MLLQSAPQQDFFHILAQCIKICWAIINPTCMMEGCILGMLSSKVTMNLGTGHLGKDSATLVEYFCNVDGVEGIPEGLVSSFAS